MDMKRFLILFVLIAFVIVSCAGPQVKYKWTKPDFSQEQFEKDHEDCIQAVKDDPEQKMSVEECLAKKGYESETETPPDKESKTVETAKTFGKGVLITTLVVVVIAVGVAVVILTVLGKGEWKWTGHR
jgi:cytochrome c-type biogenesis protein CcmH/NrfG